jgi:hypothetical protein
MTEAGFLNFTPEEYQVLEDIEFDETIQRPEKVRFYTLEEQTADAFEKMVPRGKSTRFQRDQLKKEVDRFRELYEKYVMALPEDYTLREPEYAKRFDWISPVYASDERKKYDWNTSWMPLYDNVRQPNFYPALLTALPRPYADTAEGAPYTVTEPTQMTKDDGTSPVRTLPDFLVPRTQIHEDKTIDILRVPMGGTADVVNFTGYYLQKRPLPIPNPLEEHPFLKSNEATYVPTTSKLEDVVPSLDAILTHAVPVTTDPYGEAEPFLKIYDVRLSDIPWNTWKSKFPQAEVVNNTEAPAPVEFPKPNQFAPPEKVTDIYATPYESGVSVRKWLMDRLDGGGLIVDLLRSMSIDNGSVESVPGIDMEPAEYPETTLEECSLLDKNFPDFNVTGILRRTWNIKKDKNGKEFDDIKLQCVPLEFVRQERARSGYLNRLPWKETTGDDMKKAYLRRLAEVTPVTMAPPKEAPQEKSPVKQESFRRVEVLAVEKDTARYAEDKYRDIQALLREVPVQNNVYQDSDGSFVYCAHSLALLGGDLAADRQAYYDKWCAKVDGVRVCRFCGQEVNKDVYAETDEFDAEGFKIRSKEALEVKGFHGDSIQSFTTGLNLLRPLFLLDNPHDETVMLLLSIIQALPNREQLEPLLKNGRTVAAVQFNKGNADTIAKFTGMMGIATAAVILQTHIPTLVPRRSFGPRPLKLSGYPRDSAEPEEYSIVDALMSVLRKTFEAFPTSFQGPSKQVIRAVLNAPGEVKRTVTLLLSAKSPLMKLPGMAELFAKAKAYHAGLPPVEAPKMLIPVLPPPKELGVINSFEPCPSSRPIWTSGRPPKVLQDVIPLWQGIQASNLATFLRAAVSLRVEPAPIATSEIRTRRSIGNKSKLKVGTAYRTNLLLASRIADVFRQPTPLREVDPSQSKDALRDIAQGFAFEEIAGALSSVEKRTRLEEMRTKDIAVYILQADYAEQKKEANKLRASERLSIVDTMAKKSDAERAVIGDLLKLGLAPYIITNQDRAIFAREAERLQDVFATEEEEIGVGQARDILEDGMENEYVATDHGDYGDYVPYPQGQDYELPPLEDARSI